MLGTTPPPFQENLAVGVSPMGDDARGHLYVRLDGAIDVSLRCADKNHKDRRCLNRLPSPVAALPRQC
jgi:hypothetical protein